jgi:hypothetical protein
MLSKFLYLLENWFIKGCVGPRIILDILMDRKISMKVSDVKPWLSRELHHNWGITFCHAVYYLSIIHENLVTLCCFVVGPFYYENIVTWHVWNCRGNCKDMMTNGTSCLRCLSRRIRRRRRSFNSCGHYCGRWFPKDFCIIEKVRIKHGSYSQWLLCLCMQLMDCYNKHLHQNSKSALHLQGSHHSIRPIEDIMEAVQVVGKGNFMNVLEKFHIYKLIWMVN